jgi:uncharacterized damage-inducible protein DinB
MDVLDRLLEHDDWGTAQLLDMSQGLTDARLDQSFDIGHRTLRATLEHIIYYVEFWTALMTAQPIAAPPRSDSPLAALVDRHKRAYSHFATFARRIRDEQRLEDTFVDHYGGEMTFGGAILHVILHNAEHRTEAVHILQRLDAPGLPDMIEIDHGLWDFMLRGF